MQQRELGTKHAAVAEGVAGEAAVQLLYWQHLQPCSSQTYQTAGVRCVASLGGCSSAGAYTEQWDSTVGAWFRSYPGSKFRDRLCWKASQCE